MKMKPETETALYGSIAKWINIAFFKERDQGCDSCSLCHLFNEFCDKSYGAHDCEGCPVKKDSGHAYCDGTPWKAWMLAQTYDAQLDEHFELALAELRYLVGLLPNKKKRDAQNKIVDNLVKKEGR